MTRSCRFLDSTFIILGLWTPKDMQTGIAAMRDELSSRVEIMRMDIGSSFNPGGYHECLDSASRFGSV